MRLAATMLIGALALAAAPRAELKLGEVVPDATLKGYDGKEFKLSDFRADPEKKTEGQVVVVYFQSEKCPAAIPAAEIKKVSDAWNDPKSGVKFIAVYAYGHDTEKKIGEYISANGLAYSNVWDTEKKLKTHFGAKQVNTTFVLDKAGKLIYRGAFGTINRAKEVQKTTVVDAVKAAKEGTEAPKSDGKFAG